MGVFFYVDNLAEQPLADAPLGWASAIETIAIREVGRVAHI